MEDYKDFDAAFEEVDAKPITIKLKGNFYDLPPSPSAAGMLVVKRLQLKTTQFMVAADVAKDKADRDAILGLTAQIDENTDSLDFYYLLELLVGAALVSEWRGLNLSDHELTELWKWVWATYNGAKRAARDTDKAGDGGEAGEAQALNRAQRRKKTSSNKQLPNGESSKPISPESTESTTSEQPLSA